VVRQDVGASIPVLVTLGLGIPLLVIAMISNRSGFFRAKPISYTESGAGLVASSAAESSR
jgi:hypothetical protein